MGREWTWTRLLLPCSQYLLQKYFHACNEGIVRSGATSGAVWPCGYVRIRPWDKTIINIERGGDLVRICKSFFGGAERLQCTVFENWEIVFSTPKVKHVNL